MAAPHSLPLCLSPFPLCPRTLPRVAPCLLLTTVLHRWLLIAIVSIVTVFLFCLFCRYIMMAEPDHIIVKPIPNMATREMPCGYPFFYITPKEEASEWACPLSACPTAAEDSVLASILCECYSTLLHRRGMDLASVYHGTCDACGGTAPSHAAPTGVPLHATPTGVTLHATTGVPSHPTCGGTHRVFHVVW